MTNKRSTKRALIASVISLMLCFTMLMGTTYAWFTDSVASTNNIITSGNLDVALYHTDKKDTEQEVKSDTKLFDDIELWEPGAVVYETFKVVNEGTLALKYRLSVDVTDNNDVKLTDVLKVGVIEGAASTTDRASLIGQVQSWDKLASFEKTGDLVNTNDNSVYTVVIYWEPTSNDNAYNMNNGNQGKKLEVNIGANLFATQLAYEKDSFGADYDDAAWVLANADSKVSNATELNTALQEGGLIALTDDIDGNITLDNVAEDTIVNFAGKTINGTVTVAEGQKVTLNGVGGVSATGSAPALKVGKNADVTLDGGTFTSESGSAVAIANTKTEVPMKLTINEGTAITAPTLISLDVYNGYAGAEIEINGGDFTATASGSYVRPISVGGADVTINGGNFVATNASSYCYFIDVSEKYNTETGTYDVGSVTINGGHFKSTATYSRVVVGSIGNYSNRTPGTVTINGGTFEMLGTYGVLTDVGAHVVVNDCTFVSGGSSAFGITNNNTTDRTIEVKGGNYTIVTRNSTWSIPLGSFAGSYPTDTSPVGKVIISGGTINSYICDGSTIGGSTSVDLVADGYHVVDNSDGTRSVVAD